MRRSHIATFLTLVLATFALPVQAQDAAAGEQVFRKCKACHQIGDGAKNKAGPVLTTASGRIAGTFEGFKYGK
ncbi:MAG: c-type cytochrome [Paracoccaceae bacterium]|jgi:cytochrome c